MHFAHVRDTTPSTFPTARPTASIGSLRDDAAVAALTSGLKGEFGAKAP